jgi:hypothetical protein
MRFFGVPVAQLTSSFPANSVLPQIASWALVDWSSTLNIIPWFYFVSILEAHVSLSMKWSIL